MLKLVPFNPIWISHDKIDIKGIYRRPRYVQDAYGEWERELDKDGLPTWDITTPLPIKQHVKFQSKGFEYITLADRESLLTAAKFGTVLEEDGKTSTHGDGWKQYDQHQTGGPWSWKKYAEGQAHTTTREAEQIIADVHEFGSETVLKLRRRENPHFVLPPHLQNIAPGTPRDEPKPELALGGKKAK